MNSKQKRQAAQAAKKAAEAAQTPTTPTTTTTKTPRPKSDAVIAAEKALVEAKAAAKAAKAAERASKPKAEPRPTCVGMKANGGACTAKAKLGSDKCIDHVPAIERLTMEERDVLGAFLAGLDQERVLALFVSEVGWHRAKAITKQL